MQRPGFLPPKHDRDRDVVLQIAADTRQGHARRDALHAQREGIADSRQHQQLRRVDDAAREDHLTLGMDKVLFAFV